MSEKAKEKLNAAIKNLQIADHLTYVTFPLVNEKRLIIKIFDEIFKSINNCIDAIIYHEYLYKKIEWYGEEKSNLDILISKCAGNYGLSNEQIRKIKDIIETDKKHKNSAMEFVRRESIILMSDGLGVKTLDIKIIKDYLLTAKELLMKVKIKINR